MIIFSSTDGGGTNFTTNYENQPSVI